MRKLISTILALCMVLCLLPVTAAADDASLPVNKWDVSLDETYDSEPVYKVDKDAIRIYAKGANQVYELTGTTDRPIRLWGANRESESGTIYLRLNNAEINGGIVVENSPVKLVIEVVDGTTNAIASLDPNDLTITGKGTLNATKLCVQQKTSYMPSKLYIKDTTIVVNEPASAGDSCEWNGECVLDGSANVTYISNSDYSPLKVGVKSGDPTHSLTMKGDSKLYCLQGVKTSAYSVSGLEAFDAAITLQDNAYLEAEGRATTGSYAGYGVITQGSITVEDNATIKATAYDAALSAVGNVKVLGGKIIAKSTNSNGIYTKSAISISNGATVEAEGYWPAVYGNAGVSIANSTVKATSTDDAAIFSKDTIEIRDSVVEAEGHYPALFGVGAVSIENSKVKATSTDDIAIFSKDTIEIKDSVVEANGLEDSEGIYCWYGTKASGSWITTTGSETLDTGDDTIADSVLFNGKTGKVIGNATLPADATVAQGMTLDIPTGTTLTVPEGKTFTNNGTVKLLGDLYHSGNDTTKGDLICNSHSGGTATCTEPAKCDICQKPYGDKDPTNHVGLKHTDAKAATLAEAGNIEYWFCPACGKYFSDANAANEITRESTVIPALKAPSIKPADGKGVYTKNSGKDLAFTTENMPEEIKVKVGSTVLTEGKDYTVSNGSIVLKTSYLESLGYGSYTLVVTDANGVELARTSFTKSFTVRPAQQPALSGGKTAASGSGVTSAGTGDAGVAMYAVSAVLSLTGSAWVVGKKRK